MCARLMYKISHVNECVRLSAVRRDKREPRRPLGHFPLSGVASLLTWSQSQGVMELGKVINPALQRGQDGSIKAVQKDSSIFNYCFQSREECQKEQACCLQNRRIQGAWIPYCCSPYTPPPQLLLDTFSLFIWKKLQGDTPPWKIGLSARG